METIHQVRLWEHAVGADQPLILLAGPCVIESREHTFRMAESIGAMALRLDIPFVFKASYDKANRSSGTSFRGPGPEEGLEILAEVRERTGFPVVSDIHLPDQAKLAGQILDCVQIPAFLCRQTDLLLAAAKTGKCINVKKGQFMSPEEMSNVVSKITAEGNQNVMLCERGTFFGYNRLVNDMTSIPRMKRLAPVIFDATHSCQQPGGAGTLSGGAREFVEPLALSAVAAGVDGLFLEVHDFPEKAMSDPATVYPLDDLERLLVRLLRVREAIR